MRDVDRRVAGAKKDADAAEATLAEISTKRLAELKRLPARQAVEHIDDPELTAADRQTLRHRLAGALPHTAPKRSQQRRKPSEAALGWLRLRPRRVAVVILAMVLVGIALWNTPQRLGVGRTTADVTVNWQAAGQIVATQDISAGTPIDIIGVEGDQWIARRWIPAWGYAFSPVPYNAVQVGQ